MQSFNALRSSTSAKVHLVNDSLWSFGHSLTSIAEYKMAESQGSASPAPMDAAETPGAQSNPQKSDLTTSQWMAIKQITDKVYKYRTKE